MRKIVLNRKVSKHSVRRAAGKPKPKSSRTRTVPSARKVAGKPAKEKMKAHHELPKKAAAAKEKRTKRKKDYIPSQKEAVSALNLIKSDRFAMEYINKNVSKNAVEVLNTMMTPKTDEQISLLLNMKINFVRRMLNIMQGYGITNYYVAKNNNGWLSFAWYINATKLQSFFDYIKTINGSDVVITENCNDYFICNKCYEDTKMIFDFDAAFEAKFKCGACGAKFKMITKQDAEHLLYNGEAR